MTRSQGSCALQSECSPWPMGTADPIGSDAFVPIGLEAGKTKAFAGAHLAIAGVRDPASLAPAGLR